MVRRHSLFFPSLTLFSLGGALLLTSLLPAPGMAQADKWPDGAGKVTTQRICGGCHAAEIVIGRQETKERWTQIVSDMADKGCNATDAEFNQIIDYLATNFAKPKTTDR